MPSGSLLSNHALNACAGLAHAFVCRAPEIDTDTLEKAEAINRLKPHFHQAAKHLGFDWNQVQTAEQTHGNAVAIVESAEGGDHPIPIVDGLMTQQMGVLLAIMVADCCAVSIVDSETRSVALLHSGKKGTETNITGKAIEMMETRFGSQAADLVVNLSPCIRPPHYEVDIAKMIADQARKAGVPSSQIHDEGHCTFADRERFYSYRREKGRTGRMLALLGYSDR